MKRRNEISRWFRQPARSANMIFEDSPQKSCGPPQDIKNVS